MGIITSNRVDSSAEKEPPVGLNLESMCVCLIVCIFDLEKVCNSKSFGPIHSEIQCEETNDQHRPTKQAIVVWCFC